MSKRTKTLIMALVVLVILGGGYFGATAWKNRKAEIASASLAPSLKLGNLESASLVKIETPVMTLEKIGETWQLVSLNGERPAREIELNLRQIQRLTNFLATVWVERTVDEEPADLSVYGLDETSFRTTVTDSEGNKAEYIVGNMTPSRDQYYAMEEGDPKVYAIASYSAENLMVTLDKIREKTLFQTFELKALNSFRLETPQTTIEIHAKPESVMPYLDTIFSLFILDSPYKIPRGVDGTALDKLLAVFKNLEIDEFVDDNPASLNPYGLDKPSRILLQTTDASLDLEIGNPVDGKRYAKLAGAPGVFTLYGMDSVINVKPFTLMNKFALLVNIDKAEQLSVSGGERELSADFEGEGDDAVYSLNGKKAETNSFKSFYQAVVGLIIDAETPAAARIPETAGPTITIEYRLNSPPGAQVSIALIPYNRDFYALSQEGTREFLISQNQVRNIFEKADAVVYE